LTRRVPLLRDYTSEVLLALLAVVEYDLAPPSGDADVDSIYHLNDRLADLIGLLPEAVT
jgi:hypothetical protein